VKETRLFVKPASPDLVVYDANNVRIPSAGRSVPNSTFIRRRIAEGSLISASAPAVPVAPDGNSNGGDQ
jgi:hypothetical protein